MTVTIPHREIVEISSDSEDEDRNEDLDDSEEDGEEEENEGDDDETNLDDSRISTPNSHVRKRQSSPLSEEKNGVGLVLT